MKAILKLKHWQLFLIIISAILVPDIHPFFNEVISMLYLGLYLFWMYGIITVLSNEILRNKKPNSLYFKCSSAYVLIVFGVIYFTTDYGIHINSGNYGDFGIWLIPMIVFIATVLWSLMYTFYFAAKVISLSNKEIFGKNENMTSNYFFAFWFYIIGVWFIQPKVQELLSKKNEIDGLVTK